MWEFSVFLFLLDQLSFGLGLEYDCLFVCLTIFSKALWSAFSLCSNILYTTHWQPGWRCPWLVTWCVLSSIVQGIVFWRWERCRRTRCMVWSWRASACVLPCWRRCSAEIMSTSGSSVCTATTHWIMLCRPSSNYCCPSLTVTYWYVCLCLHSEYTTMSGL